MQDVVSIIVPVYNIDRYIKNCVKSIEKQTFSNIEVILVDDGSTDNSGEICDNLALTDNRIRVIHKKNGGLSSARNAGLDVAKGNFVYFVDGDDYIALNTIEYLMKIQKITDADIVQTGFVETKEVYSECVVEVSGKYEEETSEKRFFEKLYEIGGEAASACTKLYKMDVFKNLKFKENIYHEDEYMMTKMLSKIKKVVYIPEKLYFYVWRESSIINSSIDIRKLDIFDVRENRLDFLISKGYTRLCEIEYNKYFNNLLDYYAKAKLHKNKECCEIILSRMEKMYKKYDIKVKGGFVSALYVLCRINPKIINIYYKYRLIFGHIE